MPNSTVDGILKKLHTLQKELEQEIDLLLEEKRKQFKYTFQQGRINFEKGVQALQRSTKTGVLRYIAQARIGHILSAPIIYSVLIPFLLLDFFVSVYQHICFRIYGIPRVVRSSYFVIDRQYLAYLNVIEKCHCVYCGYCNGLIEFVREVSARTEQYWCPIKHATRTYDPHRLEKNFVDYGDAAAYKERLTEIQNDVKRLIKPTRKTSNPNRDESL